VRRLAQLRVLLVVRPYQESAQESALQWVR
jgi:hypothetical protein